ncbi:putative membrane protein YfcA [Arthrobacter sp. CAN_A2]|uniref:sulfite exporter TauE/SafE family protein n=1 Tax=Arthrobacter sp. CAN_A2 TaxID=2787718 RepID=UPI0018EFBDD1
MSATLILVLALSILIGLSLGVLGGGGSILTVPILVYAAGFEAKEAIAASLFVVGVTSAISVISHARNGRVMWRTGLIFGAAGMAGAFIGGLLGGYIPGQILLIAFALMMVATSIAMIRGRRKPAKGHGTAVDSGKRELPLKRVILDGVVVGLVTGLVGAGGGFLVVPALALLGGLPMSVAVGTSLVVISMKSFAGLAGYLTTVEINWPLTLAVTAAAIVGSLIGAQLAGRIPEQALRKGFGWFVLVMGAFVLIQQAPADTRLILAAAVAGLAFAALLACRFIIPACPLNPRNRNLTSNGQAGQGRRGRHRSTPTPA